VPELVAGTWDLTNLHFVASKTQPIGKAAREVEAFRAWLRRPETAKAFADEGISHVRCVRKELPEATYASVTVVKATIN